MSLNRFEPAAVSSDTFSTDSLVFDAEGSLLFGLVGNVSYKPLVLLKEDGSDAGSVVNHQFYYHLSAQWVAASHLRVGLEVPWLLYSQGGRVRLEQARPGTSAILETGTGSGLGDPSVAVDVLLVSEPQVRIAVGARLFLPFGEQDLLAGDGRFHAATQVAVALQLAPWLIYAAHAGVDYRPGREDFAGVPVGSELEFGASLNYRSAARRWTVGAEVLGSSVLSAGASGFGASGSTPIEALLSAKRWATESIRFGLAVGSGLSEGLGAPRLRGLVSLAWRPVSAELVPAVEPLDTDSDGIADAQDACPNERGRFRPREPFNHGCPDRHDQDGDGLDDGDDACPTVFGSLQQEPGRSGCPPRDRDKDGIVDRFDACPEAFGVGGASGVHGCPSDRDGDGIVDALDACPIQPGVAHPDRERHGCLMASLSGRDILLGRSLGYPEGALSLSQTDELVLSDVAFLMKAHPEILLVSVEGYSGHEFGEGETARSRDWANTVSSWLVGRGVEPVRLMPRGMLEEVEVGSVPFGFARASSIRFRILKLKPKKNGSPLKGEKR